MTGGSNKLPVRARKGQTALADFVLSQRNHPAGTGLQEDKLAYKAMRQLGRDINLARRRRGLSFKELHERAGIAKDKISKVTRGYSGTALSDLAAVLLVLGMLDRLATLACPENDRLGPLREDEQVLMRIHDKIEKSGGR